MQRALIKSSRSCRREKEREKVGIPLSLWQSLSQIKVRFGARENNSVRARADSTRSTGSRFGIFIRRAGFIVTSHFPVLPPSLGCMCIARISQSCMGMQARGHVLGIILSKISKDARTRPRFFRNFNGMRCNAVL